MSTAKFTPQAKALWDRIPKEYWEKILSNVYCGHCRDSVTITNYTGAVKGGNLLLVGLCAVCRTDVARWIEKPSPAQQLSGTAMNTRIEHDTFGPIEVPAERLWGA